VTLPQKVRAILPADTARSWETIAEVLPPALYLIGGTALAVHVQHRVSRDLDFFFHTAVDLDALEVKLREQGPFAVTHRAPGMLNGLFSRTKVQFLDAAPQKRLEKPTPVAGIPVAGMGDILATKIKAIGDRGELRDYFDLQTIEQQTSRTVEEGIALFMERYGIRAEDPRINHIVMGLGYLDDVDEDDSLPLSKAEIAGYWKKRQREVVSHLARFSL
jgi:predicted nucleotidyltransferase component of viral defense system